MGADVSKDFGCCDCGLQQRSSILETEVNGVSSMKLHENNQRFLRAMAEGGKSDLILGLFSTTREFDVNAADESGETALHKAARNGHVICCHVLLKRGASPGIKNKEGKSALDLAQENEHAECVEYLKEPGNKGVVKKAEAQQPGQAVEAMYDYIASDDIPFAPDPRKELSMQRGQTFHLLHKRPEDGWCLVATNNKDGVEGWVPGNFITANGKEPLVDTGGRRDGIFETQCEWILSYTAGQSLFEHARATLGTKHQINNFMERLYGTRPTCT